MKELKILENSYNNILIHAKKLYIKNISDLLLNQIVDFTYEWTNPFDTVFKNILTGKVFKLLIKDDGIYAFIKIIDKKKISTIITNDEICLNIKKIIRLHK